MQVNQPDVPAPFPYAAESTVVWLRRTLLPGHAVGRGVTAGTWLRCLLMGTIEVGRPLVFVPEHHDDVFLTSPVLRVVGLGDAVVVQTSNSLYHLAGTPAHRG